MVTNFYDNNTTIMASWDDNRERRAVHLEMTGNWDWESFTEVSESVCDLFRSVDHDVHLILDFQDDSALPPGALNPIRWLLAHIPRNLDLVVIVSSAERGMKMFRRLSKFDATLSSKLVVVESLLGARVMLGLEDIPEDITGAH